MAEADKYTSEMWRTKLGRVASLVNASEPQRQAFIAGFNGAQARTVHWRVRDAWTEGRHTAILLRYIEDQPNDQ